MITRTKQLIFQFLGQDPKGIIINNSGHSLEQAEGGLMRVGSSNFMAFHSILKTSKDYYMALAR